VERGNVELDEAEYFSIVEGKTAALTSCCCRLGAMFAGANEPIIEKMADYGRLLGIAFQVADDVLDISGHEKTAGKTLGTALEQQNLTLPLIHMWQRSPADQASRYRQILSAPGNHKLDALFPALEATGAIASAKRAAEDFARQA